MNAKEILAKKFEKAAFNGYKPDDVDDFMKEVSDEFAQLQKEKSELERKLEVLADKIREYRSDEDALKDALLIAQKQGNAIVAESKASAEKLTKETNDAVTKQLADAKTKSDRLVNDADEYSKKTRAEADATSAKIIGDANAKAAEIKAAMDRQQEIQENIIQQTRKEALDFRTKLLEAFKEQMETIEKIPANVENDFIKKTAAEVEKREAEKKKQAAAKTAQQKAAPKPAAKPAEKPAERPVEKPAEKPAEKPVAKPAEAKKEEPAKPAPAKTADKTAENNLPFFTGPADAIGHHDDLKFGEKNNK